MRGYVASAEVDISAPCSEVWKGLTDPDLIAQYSFGSVVETDWQPDSPIFWNGQYEGKPFQDKGTVLVVEPGQHLEVTHFSPLSGQDDVPENYHRVSYDLVQESDVTHLTLNQDGNGSQQEAEHSARNWQLMLAGLKKVVEGDHG